MKLTSNRRNFIKNSAFASAFLVTNKFPISSFIDDSNITKLTILHTNDVHSRIDPFPQDGSRNAGLGGAAKRATLIKKIRSTEKNVLLFDSGDIIQGTPYFNFYGGEIEMKLMKEMGYDAGTLGNHDFDGGLELFDKIMPLGNFPFLVSNYNFENTILNNKTKNYTIFIKDEIRVGVFGLGIELKGLVPKTLYKETQYLDPIEIGNKTASILKNEEKCDFVICLSHLGYKYTDKKISDIVLAKSTKNIDLILGGHTHTFLERPVLEINTEGKKVVINQAGFGGLLLGQIEVFFEKNKPGKCVSCENIKIE
jgi:5'-nucleotidase